MCRSRHGAIVAGANIGFYDPSHGGEIRSSKNLRLYLAAARPAVEILFFSSLFLFSLSFFFFSEIKSLRPVVKNSEGLLPPPVVKTKTPHRVLHGRPRVMIYYYDRGEDLGPFSREKEPLRYAPLPVLWSPMDFSGGLDPRKVIRAVHGVSGKRDKSVFKMDIGQLSI